MVTEGYFIAAYLLRVGVQMAAPHPRTEIAWIAPDAFGNLENIAFKNPQRQPELLAVLFYFFEIFSIISRVHNDIFERKAGMAVAHKLLEQLGHQKAVLPAGNADGYFIALIYQLVILYGLYKPVPQLFAELFYNAALYQSKFIHLKLPLEFLGFFRQYLIWVMLYY